MLWWKLRQLGSQLHTNNRESQRKAIEELSRLRDAKAVELLVDFIRDKNNHAYVRRDAIEALGEIGDPRAAPPLIAELEGLSGYDFYISHSAALALGRFEWQPADDKQRVIHAIMHKHWDQLTSFGSTAVEPLIRALDYINEKDRIEIVRALGQLGDPRAVEKLIGLVQVKDHKILNMKNDMDKRELFYSGNVGDAQRSAVAEVLGQLGDPRAVEPLLAAYADEDQWVQKAVVNALRQIGEPAFEILINTLKGKKIDPSLRRAAAEVLGQLGDKQAVKPLITALKDKDVQTEAATALGLLRDVKAVNALTTAAQDTHNQPFATAAIKSLGQIGGEQAVDTLISILTDTNYSEFTSRPYAAQALGKIGAARAVEPLIAALEHDWRSSLRLAIVEALGKIGDGRAVEPLIRMLTYRHVKDTVPDYEKVRQTATRALMRLGDVRAVQPLVRMVAESKQTEEAIEVLTVVFKRALADVTPDDLYAVANLSPGLHEESRKYLRQLAQKELERRGLAQ